jgi:hypothetical protein
MKKYQYFERDGAVFRVPEGYIGVTHVKSKSLSGNIIKDCKVFGA